MVARAGTTYKQQAVEQMTLTIKQEEMVTGRHGNS